jgi:hypothetical protein
LLLKTKRHCIECMWSRKVKEWFIAMEENERIKSLYVRDVLVLYALPLEILQHLEFKNRAFSHDKGNRSILKNKK